MTSYLFCVCECVCGSWEFSGPPLSPLIHINHLLEFFAPLSSGGFDRFIVCLHINMYPPSQKLLQFVPVTTCADFSLLQTIHSCIANEYLLCFLVTQVIQNRTKSTLWPPNVIHSYRQHHLGNSIHLLHLLISWTDIPDSTVRLLCLACHTIRSGVRVLPHTHAPPHLHNSQTLRKYSFLRLSIPSFALGGLVNTLGIMMTFTKPTPHVCPQMRLVLIALFPFLQARWFLAEPHEDSLCSFSVPTDP